MRQRSVSEWIRKHVLGESLCGADAVESAVERMTSDFDSKCFSRLVLGALRYEQLGRGNYDEVGSAIERLQAYQATGCREHLVDAANMCRIEWCSPAHPGSHWESADDAHHAVEVDRSR